MKKNCLNPKCEKEFEPKSAKGLYCDPKCKAAHQYLLKKGEANKSIFFIPNDAVSFDGKKLDKYTQDEPLQFQKPGESTKKLLERISALEAENKELQRKLDLAGRNGQKNQSVGNFESLDNVGNVNKPFFAPMSNYLQQKQKKMQGG